MTHEEWLAARRLGVSGTDIGVLLGVNSYKSVDDLLLDKLGVGIGYKTSHTKTVTEADIVLTAGISGDFFTSSIT